MCFPFLNDTLVSAFHLVIQEGAVDECVCLLWNLHKHIEHRDSTFLRQSDSFRESFKVQPAGMQRPVIHIAFLNIWRKPVYQSQVAATLDMDAGIDKIVCRKRAQGHSCGEIKLRSGWRASENSIYLILCFNVSGFMRLSQMSTI